MSTKQRLKTKSKDYEHKTKSIFKNILNDCHHDKISCFFFVLYELHIIDEYGLMIDRFNRAVIWKDVDT
jgi:hypothetical protein